MAVKMMDRRIAFSYWLSMPTIGLLNGSAAMQLYVELSSTALGPRTTTTSVPLISPLLAAVAGLMVLAYFAIGRGSLRCSSQACCTINATTLTGAVSAELFPERPSPRRKVT
jgi:hypothetical protein